MANEKDNGGKVPVDIQRVNVNGKEGSIISMGQLSAPEAIMVATLFSVVAAFSKAMEKLGFDDAKISEVNQLASEIYGSGEVDPQVLSAPDHTVSLN